MLVRANSYGMLNPAFLLTDVWSCSGDYIFLITHRPFFASFTLLQDFLVYAVRSSPVCAQKVANVANALAKKVLGTSESSECTSTAKKIATVVCEFQSRLLTSFAIQIPGVSNDLGSLEWSDIPLILTSGEIHGDGTINTPTSSYNRNYRFFSMLDFYQRHHHHHHHHPPKTIIIMIITITVISIYNIYNYLVYTTPVNSAFRAIWLVPLSRDIKYYSPPGGFRRKKKAREPQFVVKYSSYLGTAIKPVLYILKQLFASARFDWFLYLRDIKYYSPPGGFRRLKWRANPIFTKTIIRLSVGE